MRKGLYLSITLLFLLILVAACGTSKDGAEDNPATEKVDEEATNEENNEEKEEKEEKDKEEDNHATEEEQEKDEVAEEPLYTLDNATWKIIPMDDANPEVALITIDDAPDKHALEMAYTLKELEAPAIFFVNGHFFESEEQKEIIQEIHDLGFMIGNHTYSHENLNALSEEEQYDEIVQVNDMVEEIIGERPKFFRAPFGENTDYSKSVAQEEGMILMNWTYGYDWDAEYQTKEAITDIMLHTELLSNGANLLMHDREWTNAALEDIVTGLRDQGYEIVDPKYIETIE